MKVTTPAKGPDGKLSCWTWDLYDNPFHLVSSNDWFQKPKHPIGGICGAVIGVSDINKSISYYKEVLGFDKELYNAYGKFSDLPSALNNENFKRVLLKNQNHKLVHSAD